jgi:hypothetical protein
MSTSIGGQTTRQAGGAMMRVPTLAVIYAAELRVAQAAHKTVDSLCQARTAMRAEIARPRTLALVAAGTGLLAWWVVRRRPHPVKPPRGMAGLGRMRAVLGSAVAFVLRSQLQRLPLIFNHLASAWWQRSASGGSKPVAVPNAEDAANRLRH